MTKPPASVLVRIAALTLATTQPAYAGPFEDGEWGPVIPWPHIAVSGANLPDGRILTWSGSERDTYPVTEQTYSATWDPATGQFEDILQVGHNMFCAHLAMMEDGRVFVNGGRNSANSPWVSLFDYRDNAWVQIENMASGGRWYPTTLALPDGSMFTAVGASSLPRHPERWNPDTGWQIQNGIDFGPMILDPYYLSGSHPESHWWPLLHVAPSGQIFHSGPTPRMHWIDATGNGSAVDAGMANNGFYHKHGVTVMYDEGRLLTAGGWISGENAASTNLSFTVDLSAPAPIIEMTDPMLHPRKFHNGVMLPNGQVLVIGGNTSGQKTSDAGAILAAEIWHPENGAWTEVASMDVPRNYHSIALLLTDGRVLAAGSGYCPASALCGGSSHKDGQVYSPPYLFAASGQLAARPSITNGPGNISSGEVFDLTASPGLARFTMIKMSSTTHSINTDLRFLELPFEATSPGLYALTAHANVNVLTPGYWMLFALDSDGVPSMAHVMQVNTHGLPWIASIGDQSSGEGTAVALQVRASDADNDPIAFSAIGLPPGITIDTTTGLIAGTASAAGDYDITVTVSDNDEGSRSKSFQWSVTQQPTGGIIREFWTGLYGDAVANLVNSPDFPGTPDGLEPLVAFEGPTDQSDAYGARIRGFLHATTTGEHIFWIAADDSGELWLSGDTDPANRQRIAYVPDATASREWTAFPEQRSTPVFLQADTRYYIEALHKEDSGSDHIAVAWQTPGTSGPQVIGGDNLSPFAEISDPPPNIIAGVVDDMGSNWQTVTLPRFFADMIVVATPEYSGASLPAVTRVRNAAGTTFDLKVQNPGGATLTGYRVHYVAMNSGRYVNEGVPMEAVKLDTTATSNSANWNGEERSYIHSYTNPVVLGQIMSANDPEWSVFWASGSQPDEPPSASEFFVGRHVGADPVAQRAAETIGYIVIESGNGQFGALSYAASTGADGIQGITDGSTSYVLGQHADAAMLSSAGMNDADGGWPVLRGPDALAGSALQISIDEDQIVDSERSHASEQVAYFAIAGDLEAVPVVNQVVTSAAATDTTVQFTISSNVDYLQYKWNFGDGSPETSYSENPMVEHVFASAGIFVVVITIRNPLTLEESFQTIKQVIHWPLTTHRPSQSATIAICEDMGQIWSVNPDNDTVSVIDSLSTTRIAELAVAEQPSSVACAANGYVWVVSKAAARITVFDSASLVEAATIILPHSSQPHGLVISPVANDAFVGLEASGVLLKLNTDDYSEVGSVFVGPRIRHMSLSADGNDVLVSHFVTPPLPEESTATPIVEAGGEFFGGRVSVVDAESMAVVDTITLQHGDRSPSEHTGPGVPNYLGPAVISPDGRSAWVPSKQDNILAGALRGGEGMTFDQTVRAITSKIDLLTGVEHFPARIDHDNASVASHAAFGPNGAYLFSALEGNREVAISDAYSATELARFDVGRAPHGLAVSEDGLRLYVHNFLDRSVSLYDVSPVTQSNVLEVTEIAVVSTVSSESLSPEILLGKQLFYDARDPRLAADSYMSCAACHNDGGQDGRVWDFTGLGEGLRNTITLNGRAGMSHGFLHWSANFDEIQDFENPIRDFAGGLGLMSDADYQFGTRAEALGDTKAGLSADLDALAAYVSSLNAFEASPHRNADGTLTPDAALGRQLFIAKGCFNCHGGQRFTDSSTDGVTASLHDVGTLDADSGQRLGGTLTGLDTPSLISAWKTAPYLHDGSAFDLSEAVAAHAGLNLSDDELYQVSSYLDQLDGVTSRFGNPLPGMPTIRKAEAETVITDPGGTYSGGTPPGGSCCLKPGSTSPRQNEDAATTTPNHHEGAHD